MTHEPKRCLYCLRFFAGKARCCSPDCERRIRGKVAYVTRSRRDAITRGLAEQFAKGRHRKRWRQIAMSPEADAQLEAVFGVALDSQPIPRHGDTLDLGTAPKASAVRKPGNTRAL